MFRSYQLTLTGAAQRLSDALGDGVGVVNPVNNFALRLIMFQGLKANTNDIFVGHNSSVSSTIHGFRVDATDSAQPIIIGGFDEGPIKLSDFWVLGTANEVLVVAAVAV